VTQGAATQFVGSIIGKGVAANVAGAAIAGAAGSAASQLAGMALGAVDDFSWEQVALAAATAGALKGVGYAGLKVGSIESISANAAASYGTNYLGSKVLGKDVSFNWKNLAASVAGAYAGSQLGGAGGYLSQMGLENTHAIDYLSGFASSATASVLRGESFSDNAGVLAVDSFGNALGYAVVGEIELQNARSSLTASTNASFSRKAYEKHISDSYGVFVPPGSEADFISYSDWAAYEKSRLIDGNVSHDSGNEEYYTVTSSVSEDSQSQFITGELGVEGYDLYADYVSQYGEHGAGYKGLPEEIYTQQPSGLVDRFFDYFNTESGSFWDVAYDGGADFGSYQYGDMPFSSLDKQSLRDWQIADVPVMASDGSFGKSLGVLYDRVYDLEGNQYAGIDNDTANAFTEGFIQAQGAHEMRTTGYRDAAIEYAIGGVAGSAFGLGLRGLGALGKSVGSRFGWGVSNNAALERSFLGSSEGHQFARIVSPGGTGTALAGHGKYVFGSGDVVVPNGSAVTLPREGIRILDETGRYIEVGDWDGLARAAGQNPRIAKDIEGMTTWLPGAKVPNYTLSAPTNPPLNILQNSTTVESGTTLDRLLQPKMGCVHWAACTEFK
ncbi:putative adhesin, partial [Enterovibrio norvegicus]|uniref:putative adhesin n=1 Tax=Enterovibrio norvegicus TaxID=188144 RepID=UPI001C701D56